MRDETQPGRYLTIDHWVSELNHQKFRQQFDAEFRQLGQRCGHMTDSEELVGHFAVVAPRPPDQTGFGLNKRFAGLCLFEVPSEKIVSNSRAPMRSHRIGRQG